jgi:ABC-type Fe3+-hydroxamate transport system substrate-binding protein
MQNELVELLTSRIKTLELDVQYELHMREEAEKKYEEMKSKYEELKKRFENNV